MIDEAVVDESGDAVRGSGDALREPDDTLRAALLGRTSALPDRLARLLLAARRLEGHASGPARREAFRVGRAVISGLLTAGYSLRSIADVLEVSADSVRSRAQRGPIDTFILAALADITVDELAAHCARTGVAIIDGRLASDDLARALNLA